MVGLKCKKAWNPKKMVAYHGNVILTLLDSCDSWLNLKNRQGGGSKLV